MNGSMKSTFIYILVQKSGIILTVKREKTLKSMQKIDMLQCTRQKYPEWNNFVQTSACVYSFYFRHGVTCSAISKVYIDIRRPIDRTCS